MNVLSLKQRTKKIISEIKKTAKNSEKSSEKIKIIAVTKHFPIESWYNIINCNINDIGESRIQETEKKIKSYKNKNKNIKLHLIGHLQSNKVSKAVKMYDIIHTVDSIKIAKKINREAEKINKKQKIFIQININKDKMKYGFIEENVIKETKEISQLKNVELIGVMTIPKNNLNNNEIAKAYLKTRKIKETIEKTIDKNCKYLSMGMSNDYKIAIQEGATHIRLGTVLFGNRND